MKKLLNIAVFDFVALIKKLLESMRKLRVMLTINTFFLSLLLCVSVFGLVSCSNNEKDIVKEFNQKLNRERFDDAAILLHEDFVATYPASGEQFKELFIKAYKETAEMDQRFKILEIQSEGNLVQTKEQGKAIFDSLFEIKVPVFIFKSYTLEGGLIKTMMIDSISDQRARDSIIDYRLAEIQRLAKGKYGLKYHSMGHVKIDLLELTEEFADSLNH